MHAGDAGGRVGAIKSPLLEGHLVCRQLQAWGDNGRAENHPDHQTGYYADNEIAHALTSPPNG